jgi:sporulation protein YlmC with PRC-barrel domain
MDLIGDVLDHPVLDRNGRDMGRVDGIELEFRNGEQPRVTSLLIGPSVLAERNGGWTQRVWRTLTNGSRFELAPVRVPLDGAILTRGAIRLNVAIGETGAPRIERLARQLIAHLPGARR